MNAGTVPASVAVDVVKAIAEGRVVEDRDVALNLLEEIVVEADAAMTRLQTGEAVTGSSSLKKIKDMARDALRFSSDGVST